MKLVRSASLNQNYLIMTLNSTPENKLLIPLHRDAQGELYFYDKKISDVVQDYSRPRYVYHLPALRYRATEFKKYAERYLGANFQIHYAMKANCHHELLSAFSTAGIGMDVVSGGELMLCQNLQIDPQKIIYSGVGKTKKEILASIEAEIFQINVESVPELLRISEISKSLNKSIGIGLRVNPNVDVQTHPHIATGFRDNKFGIDMAELPQALEVIKSNALIRFQGLSLHIGSQIFDFSPVKMAIEKLLKLHKDLLLQGYKLTTFDIGGGVGVDYRKDGSEDFNILEDYFKTVSSALEGLEAKILCEPGRFLASRSGILLTEVQYVKQTPWKKFIICDTGMNHIIRPVLYEAYHRILPVRQRDGSLQSVDIVGPVCESADFLAKNRDMPPVAEGDLLVIAEAGAYGQVMSSSYNLFPQPMVQIIK